MIVSCIILNYNDWSTTATLVKNVQDYKSIDHIIVVDNLSTDDSYDCLKELENDKVVVITTEKNGGYGYGNNYGIKYANEVFKSDYVLICNPDVFFEEKAIVSAVRIMQQDPRVAVVAPIQLNAHGNVANTIAWRVPSTLQYILCSGLLMKRLIKSYAYKKSELCEGTHDVDCVPGSFLFVKTDSFLNVGGYDESIFLYCEETVLGIKMKKAGFVTVLDASETYLHLHSVSINKSISKEVNRTKLLLQSRKYVIKRYLDGNKMSMQLANMFFSIVLLEMRIKMLFVH